MALANDHEMFIFDVHQVFIWRLNNTCVQILLYHCIYFRIPQFENAFKTN